METLQFSLSGLFMFYMIISANFFVPLLSCRTQALIADSMTIRHLLGFLTMIFFVVLANVKEKVAFKKIVGIAAALYLWFMMTTKMNDTLWKFLFFLLGTYYFIYMYEQNNTEEKPEEKQRIDKVKGLLFTLSAVVTVVGVLLYSGEKKIEYGKKFRWNTFILGNPVCRKHSPAVGVVTALQAIIH